MDFIFSPLIYCQTKRYLKMDWCNMHPHLYHQKGVPLFISAQTWRDLVAVETSEIKIQ